MIKDDVKLGKGAVVFQPDLVNLYGCVIGARTKIGAFVEILREAGVFAEVVENGREAIRRLEAQDFDLVLMDVQMPVMDGLTAAETIGEKRI